jgi:hypothetical protein
MERAPCCGVINIATYRLSAMGLSRIPILNFAHSSASLPSTWVGTPSNRAVKVKSPETGVRSCSPPSASCWISYPEARRVMTPLPSILALPGLSVSSWLPPQSRTLAKNCRPAIVSGGFGAPLTS